MHPSFAEALIGNDNAENNLEIFRPLIVVHEGFNACRTSGHGRTSRRPAE